MGTSFFQKMRDPDLGERMLNGAAIISSIGIVLPWISGEWFGGEEISFTGLQFYTSYIGLGVLLLNGGILSCTVLPLLRTSLQYPKQYRDPLRLILAVLSSILLLAALSVLMKFTLEFSRLEVRFGIYVALFGSLFMTLESFCTWKERKVKESPHHSIHFPIYP